MEISFSLALAYLSFMIQCCKENLQRYLNVIGTLSVLTALESDGSDRLLILLIMVKNPSPVMITQRRQIGRFCH